MTGQRLSPTVEALLLGHSVKLLKKMVSIPSPSFGETEVSNLLSETLTAAGISHKRLKNNIIAVNKGWSPDKDTLMLCAHMDTVTAAAGYDFDPYLPDYNKVATVLKGIFPGSGAAGNGYDWKVVAGLGSNDDGASAVCLISAFRYFYDRELPINLMLVLDAEEERSGPDGMDLVWKALGEGTFKQPRWAIVGEPTGMKAATAERGLLVIDAVAHGVSGHAAREEGVNAIYEAMEDIRKMLSYRFDKVSPSMGNVKLTVTQINAGTVHNVVPDTCSFVVDIRPTEQYTNAEIVELLRQECKSTLTPRNLRNRSSSTRPDSPLLQSALATGRETFVSPTTSDWMRISCDAIKMGPGDSARSHRKNEYVTVEEIRDGIKGYIFFITDFCRRMG